MNPVRELAVAVEHWPIAGGFTISRGSRTEAVVVVATLRAGVHRGSAECVPYARYGESVDGVVAQIEGVRGEIERGIDRAGLQRLLPAGAARNALDCALWRLEASERGCTLAALAHRPEPTAMITAFTLSLGEPDAMHAAAARAAGRPLLKVKLGGAGDPQRIAAVRAGAPAARLVVDANEAWREDVLHANLAACEAAGVELVEQPMPAQADQALAGVQTSIVLCADESIHDAASLATLPPWYRAVNIKLDKSGGLTDALVLLDGARTRGLRVMVGCMLGTSLAMEPALVLAQGADWVDLDGPLLLARDREPGLRFEGSTILPG